jgi:hypothetical protein
MHLTEDDFGKAAMRTPVGMAYVIGSGPKSRTCRECAHWQVPLGLTRYPYKRGQLGKGHCAENTRQRGGKRGPDIEHGNASCKYFTTSDNPPPLNERKGRL